MIQVTIGCDPEFVIINKEGNLIPAKCIISDPVYNNNIGTDMNSSLVEFRPPPSKNIYDILVNIQQYLKFMVDKYPFLKECKFIAGHSFFCKVQSFSVGGHIHIGFNNDNKGFNSVYPEFVTFINKCILGGFMYIINDRKGQKERRKQNFGISKDCRSKNGIFEYRVPPSWLVNPTLAFIFLSLAKICALVCVNKDELELTNKIDEICSSKKRGGPLLLMLINIVEPIPSFMREKDIQNCINILKIIRGRHNLCWNKDFKNEWSLE